MQRRFEACEQRITYESLGAMSLTRQDEACDEDDDNDGRRGSKSSDDSDSDSDCDFEACVAAHSVRSDSSAALTRTSEFKSGATNHSRVKWPRPESSTETHYVAFFRHTLFSLA